MITTPPHPLTVIERAMFSDGGTHAVTAFLVTEEVEPWATQGVVQRWVRRRLFGQTPGDAHAVWVSGGPQRSVERRLDVVRIRPFQPRGVGGGSQQPVAVYP